MYGQPGYQPQKTNTMAILGPVFAFGFSPLGVVFSAIGLKQIKERREGGRGLALAGLIISIISLVLGILMLVLFATVLAPAVEKAAQSESAADAPADDPTGVVGGLRRSSSRPASPRVRPRRSPGPEASPRHRPLRPTIASAAGQTNDPAFIAHVQKFSGDFPADVVDTAAYGEDPSSLEPALTADGTQIDDDCAAAGYVQ